MKKIISVLLVLTMIFSMSAMKSFAADDSLSVIFATDMHYAWEDITNNGTIPEVALIDEENGFYDIDTAFITQDENFNHVPASGQLLFESGAILDEFLRQAKENTAAKFVVISGDLTDTGSEEASLNLAAKLEAFERETGKSVYVIPGNHDVSDNPLSVKVSKDRFKEIYHVLGYAEANAKDSASASYTADISKDYRLLMIDSTGAEDGGYQFDETRINWIKAQCEKAKSERKHLIAVMHHNILQHFAFDFIHEGTVIDSKFGLKELFAEYDVKYTFSGHSHAQDIMEYKAENGNTIYEVVTGALNAYPLSYRVVNFADSGVKFSTKSINSVDTSSFDKMMVTVGGETKRAITDEAITHAKADFKGYSQKAYRIGIKELFSEKLCTSTLKTYLGVDYSEKHQVVARIIDKIGAKLEESLSMPLYDKDKGKIGLNVPVIDPVTGKQMLDDEGNPVMKARYSIQEITESYGGTLPPTHYKDLLDVLVLLYETHVSGGEGLTYHSDEFFIFVHGFAAALNYCLFSVSEYEYGILIKFMANKFEPTVLGKLPAEMYAYMAGGKQGFEQNIIFMTYLISPFLKSTVTDSIPSDRDITLAAYKAYAEPTPPSDPDDGKEDPTPAPPAQDNSFRAKLVAFFDRVTEFFRMVIRILTFQEVF